MTPHAFGRVAVALLTISACSDSATSLSEIPALTTPTCTLLAQAVAGPAVVVAAGDRSQGDPRIVALSGGGFAIAWVDYEDVGDEDVWVRVYDSAGEPLGDAVRANTFASYGQYLPTLTALAGGGFVVGWESTPYHWQDEPTQDGSGSGVYARFFDAAGDPIGDEVRVHVENDRDQGQLDVSALADGGAIFVWWSATDLLKSPGPTQGFGFRSVVRARRFDAMGVAQTDELLVADTVLQENLETEPDQPSVAGLDDGGWAVTWTRARLRPDGEYRVPYPRTLQGRRFGADDAPLGPAFQVSQEPRNLFSDEYASRVVGLPGSSFAVAWLASRTQGKGAVQRRFDASGFPRAGEEVSSGWLTGGSVDDVGQAPIPGFGALVSWNVSEGGDYSLGLQALDAHGEPLDLEPWTWTFDGSRPEARAALLTDGALVVGYRETAEDFKGDIAFQRFVCP